MLSVFCYLFAFLQENFVTLLVELGKKERKGKKGGENSLLFRQVAQEIHNRIISDLLSDVVKLLRCKSRTAKKRRRN